MIDTVLVFNRNQNNAATLAKLISSRHIKTHSESEDERLLETIEENPYRYILVINDSDQGILKNISVFEKIKLLNQSLPIILISDETDIQLLTNITNIGISAIFKLLDDIDEIIQKIISILNPDNPTEQVTTSVSSH